VPMRHHRARVALWSHETEKSRAMLQGNEIVRKVRAVEAAFGLPPIQIRFESGAPFCVPFKDASGLHMQMSNTIAPEALANELTLLAATVESQRSGAAYSARELRTQILRICNSPDESPL
jgi:hypothetical protein